MVLQSVATTIVDVNPGNLWTFKAFFTFYGLWCSQGMVNPMLKDLKSKEDFKKLLRYQFLFVLMAVTAGGCLLTYVLDSFFIIDRRYIRITYNFYGIFEVAISFMRLPKKLLSPRYLKYSTILFVVSEIFISLSIPLNVAGGVIDVYALGVFAKVIDLIGAVLFLGSEINTLYASQRMLRTLPDDFTAFHLTKRVLKGLSEANAYAVFAGSYSLLYVEFGLFAMESLAILCGAKALQCYAKVFNLTREIRRLKETKALNSLEDSTFDNIRSADKIQSSDLESEMVTVEQTPSGKKRRPSFMKISSF